MAIIKWESGPVPEGMKITQVYGIILDRTGRVMLRVDNKQGFIRYSLAGGRPEPYDAGIEGDMPLRTAGRSQYGN